MAKKSAKTSAKTARSAKSAKSTRSTRGAAGARTGARGAATKGARKGAAKKTARSSGARKTTRGAAARKSSGTGSRKTARKSSGRRPNPAFMKPLTPSPELAEIVGSKPLPRTEATSRLWDYIKKHDLQDSKNRRMIKADPALKAVFGGRSQVNMFEMTKLVAGHLS